MEANFSDYINDAVRVLVLLNAVKERKSMKVTEHRPAIICQAEISFGM